MANKRTRAVSPEEYNSIISTIRAGFTTSTGHRMKPHIQVATALICEINLGMRISDIIELRLSDIVFEGGRYHLNNIIEKKTKKIRNFVVPAEVYIFLQSYALERGISPQDKLFSIGTRTVQNYLQRVCEHLGLKDIGSHSFRKSFAQALYKNSQNNIELTRQALQHTSILTTQVYLGVNTEMVEQALENHVMLPA